METRANQLGTSLGDKGADFHRVKAYFGTSWQIGLDTLSYQLNWSLQLLSSPEILLEGFFFKVKLEFFTHFFVI